MSTDPLESNVQQQAPEPVAVAVALSQEDRRKLENEVKELQAKLDTIKEDICALKESVAGTRAALKDAREATTAAEECLLSSTPNDFAAALRKYPLLQLKTKRVLTKDKKKAIRDYLDEQVAIREKLQAKVEEREARLFAARDKRDKLEEQLAQMRTRLLASTLPTRQPNPQRKQRWIELNEILQGNAKKSKLNDSTAYSYIAWNQVKSVFNLASHDQPRKEIPDSHLDFLTKYLTMATKCLGRLVDSKEAKRLHYIAPVLIIVCHLLDGDVQIAVEEDLHGNFLNAHGHFEFMLKRGKKAVCIVEAKKDNLDQGMAQYLVGCEVVAELGELDIVYGIVTNYTAWNFYKSCNDTIEVEECVLNQTSAGPEQESLKNIAEKIYYMLSNEEVQVQ